MGLFSRARDMEVDTAAAQPAELEEDIPSLPTPLTSTVIATGLTVSGTLEGKGVIQVEGAVKGKINLDGAVIVTTTGSIEGPVTANVIQIAGSVRGNCVAREHMCLEKTGSLEGDVTTTSLIVHDGGRLNGRSNMVAEIAATVAAVPSALPEDGEELQFGANYQAEDGPGHKK